MKLSLPTGAQLSAFGRHVITYAAGAATVGVAAHFLNPDQGSQLTAGIGDIISGVNSIVGGVATLVALGSGLYAAWTASPSSQAAAIGANSSTIVNAGPNGTATVTLPPEMASAALTAQKKSA